MFPAFALLFTFIKSLAIILAVSVLLYTCLVLWYRYKYRHLPCPKPVSFFQGHLPAMREATQKNGHRFDLFTQWANELSSVFVLYLLHKPVVITWDPEAVKEICVTGNFPKSQDFYRRLGYVFGVRFLGNGLITDINHARWMKKRHEMNPAFNKSTLKELTSKFNTVGDRLIEQLGKRADNKEMVELCSWFHKAALDIICLVAFGKDIDCLAKGTPFSSAMTKVMKIASEHFRDPAFELPFMTGQRKKNLSKALRHVEEVGKQWTEEREAAIKNGEYVPNDILNKLVEMKGKGLLDDEELLDEFKTFFIAGYETTANTLGFSLMQAGRHPEVLKKMYDEVDDVVGQKAHITYDDVNKMDYIHAVWKESLRLFPIAPMTARDIDRHGVKIAGYNIPMGGTVMVCMYVSSRMPSLVKDPLDFKPERFLGQSPERPNTYSYLPFLIGPRNCIGQNFASLEGRILIAKFLQNFHFELDPTQSFGILESVALQPKDKVRATLSWRKTV